MPGADKCSRDKFLCEFDREQTNVDVSYVIFELNSYLALCFIVDQRSSASDGVLIKYEF